MGSVGAVWRLKCTTMRGYCGRKSGVAGRGIIPT
ncbi:membrane protein [Rhodobacteraceae phage LS06-2018-MD07]|nr:membrane protein [Rhodobacteraceae phage LS06-2018-MD07]